MIRPVSNGKRQRLVRNRIIVPKHGRRHRIIVALVPVRVLSSAHLQLPPVEADGIEREGIRRPAQGGTRLDAGLVQRERPRVLVGDPAHLVQQERRRRGVRQVVRGGHEIDAPAAREVLSDGDRGHARGRHAEGGPVLERRDGVQSIRRVGRDKVHDARWGFTRGLTTEGAQTPRTTYWSGIRECTRAGTTTSR
jgi:hypothetical protein